MSYTGGYEAVRMHNIRAITHNISAMQRALPRLQYWMDKYAWRSSQRAHHVAEMIWWLERGTFTKSTLLSTTRIPTDAA